MKKIFFAFAACAALTASAEIYNYLTITQGDKVISIPISTIDKVCFTEDNQSSGDDYTLRVLTFEDNDYVGSGNYLGFNDWSSLIDEQYGGPLLYGDMSSSEYRWHDEGNTELCAALDPDKQGGMLYWSGGEAISNYVNANYATEQLDYMQQLASPNGGHNGSQNFCVHNGFFDGVFYTAPRGGMWFADNKARVIDHLYVSLTSYGLSNGMVGSAFSEPLGDDDWVKFVAIGTDANGDTSEVEITMVENGKFTTDWVKWDISSLGEIVRLDFNITSSAANDFGMTFPGYIAIDDIAVRFPR
ncbi:MAG: DUF4465 domain-containing protein [Muribaculaceae bacterium]|nr:DUF4465 domain-containing protein [Muribaculaceae bacterium]MCF0205533.1 DUF4465 domain-containing protein [Muribaculaceae bacterium]